MNTNINCNTPGIPEEANEKFLWREETSGLTGQWRYGQKYKMHMKTLHHEQKSEDITKSRFRPPWTSANMIKIIICLFKIVKDKWRNQNHKEGIELRGKVQRDLKKRTRS